MKALEHIDAWPVPTAAAAVISPEDVLATRGPADEVLRWASVTKLFTAYALLIAAEEGVLDLDEPAGPEGSTVRHLLAHASGLPFEGDIPIARPGERRIYSNAGFDLLGELLAARAEMPFAAYLQAAVLDPLGLGGTELRGRPSEGLHGPLADLAVFGRELLAPTLLASGDPRRGDRGRLPGPRRRASRPGTPGAERLGPRVRAQGREAAALDRRRATHRARSATSAARGRSSGSTRTPRSRARA